MKKKYSKGKNSRKFYTYKEGKERKKKIILICLKIFVDFIFVVQHCNIIFLMIICGVHGGKQKTTFICGSCVGAQKSRG